MKKAISIFFAAVLFLTLAACDGGSGGGGSPPTKVQEWYKEYIKDADFDYEYEYSTYAKERAELGDYYKLNLRTYLDNSLEELKEMDASQFESMIVQMKADAKVFGDALRAHYKYDEVYVLVSLCSTEPGQSKNFGKEVCAVLEIDWSMTPNWREPPIWGYR